MKEHQNVARKTAKHELKMLERETGELFTKWEHVVVMRAAKEVPKHSADSEANSLRTPLKYALHVRGNTLFYLLQRIFPNANLVIMILSMPLDLQEITHPHLVNFTILNTKGLTLMG